MPGKLMLMFSFDAFHIRSLHSRYHADAASAAAAAVSSQLKYLIRLLKCKISTWLCVHTSVKRIECRAHLHTITIFIESICSFAPFLTLLSILCESGLLTTWNKAICSKWYPNFQSTEQKNLSTHTLRKYCNSIFFFFSFTFDLVPVVWSAIECDDSSSGSGSDSSSSNDNLVKCTIWWWWSFQVVFFFFSVIVVVILFKSTCSDSHHISSTANLVANPSCNYMIYFPFWSCCVGP